MATHIGIGFSREENMETAAREAAFLSKTDLNVDTIDIALVFSTIHYDPQETLPILQEILNQTKIIGCSTAGIILSESIETRGLAVLTISSDDIEFGTGYVDNLDTQDTQRAGSALARNTLADFGDHTRHAFLFLADGHLKNNSVLLKGLQEILGPVIPTLGAGSCDDFRFQETFQLFNEEILNHAATGLLIGGRTTISVACRHGWRPLGKPRILDKVQDNIIRTIDGKKAFSLYEEYFGDEAQGLHSSQFGKMSILYPLGISIEGSHEYLLRNITSLLQDGSIVCQGNVPQGREVHIMISNKESCKQAAIDAAEEAHKGLAGKNPSFVIIFESMARLKLLGQMAFEEVEYIRHIFGSSVPLIGMYTNGEVSPFQTMEKFKKPYLLNESIVVFAIA